MTVGYLKGFHHFPICQPEFVILQHVSAGSNGAEWCVVMKTVPGWFAD
jgi:hypothetical protein